MKRSFSIPPVYFSLCLVLCVVVCPIFPSMRIIPFPYNLSGIVFVVCGIVLLILSLRRFTKHGTPENYHEEITVLVSDGPYRFSRNPQFLAGAIILAGSAVLTGNVLSLLSSLLFVVLMEIIFIRDEEKVLFEKFGERFTEYARRVRRWL